MSFCQSQLSKPEGSKSKDCDYSIGAGTKKCFKPNSGKCPKSTYTYSNKLYTHSVRHLNAHKKEDSIDNTFKEIKKTWSNRPGAELDLFANRLEFCFRTPF